jgi:hypothetical protein
MGWIIVDMKKDWKSFFFRQMTLRSGVTSFG